MCTVTVIPLGEGFRLISNRDELRTRSRAAAPRASALASGAMAAWPVDPSGGGTWIAASERGLALTILNGNPTPPVDLPPADEIRSRGLIIPPLIDLGSAGQAIAALHEMHLASFAPFRLIAVDEVQLIDAVWDRTSVCVRRGRVRPVCYVSSGLGDALVEVRLELFGHWMKEHGPTAVAQRDFHEHCWPDRRHLSVLMERPDARTVAITSIDTSIRGAVTIEHHDLLAGEGEPRVHELSLAAPVSAARDA